MPLAAEEPTYAFYTRCDQGVHSGSGLVPPYCKDSTYAEMYAIVQAVTKVSVNSRHGQVQGLVVDVIPANHVRSAIYCVRFEGTIAPTITPNPNESWFEAKLVSRI